GADRLLQAPRCRCPRRLLGPGAGAGVEVRTVLVVADPADAPVSRGRSVRARDAGGRTRLHRLEPRRADQHRRELRGPAGVGLRHWEEDEMSRTLAFGACLAVMLGALHSPALAQE